MAASGHDEKLVTIDLDKKKIIHECGGVYKPEDNYNKSV